jgi:hypothetical protein
MTEKHIDDLSTLEVKRGMRICLPAGDQMSHRENFKMLLNRSIKEAARPKAMPFNDGEKAGPKWSTYSFWRTVYGLPESAIRNRIRIARKEMRDHQRRRRLRKAYLVHGFRAGDAPSIIANQMNRYVRALQADPESCPAWALTWMPTFPPAESIYR